MASNINTLTWLGIAVVGVPVLLTMCTMSGNYNRYTDRANKIQATADINRVDVVSKNDNATITSEKKAAVVDHFISDAEPNIKDAFWSNDNTLMLGMLDDGSNRDGMADYACQVLIDDFNISSINIYIVDIAKIANGGKWDRLGSASC